MALVSQLDKNGFFLGVVDDCGQGMPYGCIADSPPDDALLDHHRWQWISDQKKYIQTPDYRGLDVYTPDGSVYQPNSFGPLPEGHSLVPPGPTLDHAFDDARMRIKARRLEVEYGGFEFEGQGWDSGEKDASRLTSAVSLLEKGAMPSIYPWKISGGTYVTLTLDLAVKAAAAMAAHFLHVFTVEEAKNKDLAALKAAAETAITEASYEEKKDVEALHVQKIEAWLDFALVEGW